jgi:hypothetical protein
MQTGRLFERSKFRPLPFYRGKFLTHLAATNYEFHS